MARKKKQNGNHLSGGVPRRRPEPVDIELSLNVKLGDRPEDKLALVRGRRLRIAGGILAYRDRILRRFLSLLVQLGTIPPRQLRRQWQRKRR